MNERTLAVLQYLRDNRQDLPINTNSIPLRTGLLAQYLMDDAEVLRHVALLDRRKYVIAQIHRPLDLGVRAWADVTWVS